MFIEHIDQLRCTADHPESWLIASFTKREDRFVVDAVLGCHVCQRRYPIVDGVAYFGVIPASERERSERVTSEGAASRDVAGGDTEGGDLTSGGDTPDSEQAVRVAAFLNAAERSTLVLAGTWAEPAHAIAQLLPLTVFAVDPLVPLHDSAQISIIRSSEGIPLSRGTVHGVALDRTTATPVNVATALQVLKPGGRLVGPMDVAPPPQMTVLANDEHYWIAEKPRDVIPLRRA